MPLQPDATQLAFDHDQRALVDTTFAVFDLETTGLRPDEDRITEVGAVKVRGGVVLGEFQTLVHPGVTVPPAITAVTGISDALVADAPPLSAVLPMFVEFLEGTVLVAHNAPFDTGFLNAALVRHGYQRLSHDVVDTARLARRLVRDEVRDRRLATLARFFRSPTTPVHRALEDARATVVVLHGLLERAGTIGVTTVEDLLDQQRSRSEPAFRKRGLADGAPDTPGVYRFHDGEGRVLYVGTSGRLRTRLRQYFGQDERRKIDAMVREAAEVTWTTTPTRIEAAARELRELARRKPRFNRRSTRPPASRWLKWADEPFPRISIARSPGDDQTLTFGPLPGRRAADALVEAIQDAVPLRRCTFRIRRAQDHPSCMLKDIGRCGAPCDGTIDAATYAAQVRDARAMLEGDPTAVLEALRVRMAALAASDRFEEAAEVRARLHTLATRVHTVRLATALRDVELLEVARHRGNRWEAVRIRHGLLTASASVHERHGCDAAVDALRGVADELPDVDRDEGAVRGEVELLARWLDEPGAVIVAVVGNWVHPVAGGATTAATVAEATTVARATRRDRRLLSGRRARQTSSNQEDHASGGDTDGPGSRPRHDARIR